MRLQSKTNILSSWKNEYSKHGLPTSNKNTPSHAAELISSFINKPLNNSGKILDLGCGTGRNAIYFAKLGYHVDGLELVPDLKDIFEKKSREHKVNNQTTFHNGSITMPFKWEYNTFDAAIALTSIENITCINDMKTFIESVLRVIKPSGYLALYYITDRDSFYKPRIMKNHGSKLKLTWSEDTELLQRVYNRKEILELFSESFSEVLHNNFIFTDFRYNKTYVRNLDLIILQNNKKF